MISTQLQHMSQQQTSTYIHNRNVKSSWRTTHLKSEKTVTMNLTRNQNSLNKFALTTISVWNITERGVVDISADLVFNERGISVAFDDSSRGVVEVASEIEKWIYGGVGVNSARVWWGWNGSIGWVNAFDGCDGDRRLTEVERKVRRRWLHAGFRV